MPKIYCCNCSRRTDKSKDRTRIGAASVWPLFLIHVEKNGLDASNYSPDDFICAKCYSMIAHYRMNDRGKDKKVKEFKPFVFEPSITKNVLRSSSNPIEIAQGSSEPSIEISNELLVTIDRNESETGKIFKLRWFWK